jgi:soluble lytic murein transglycosylase-like protein
MLKLKYLLKEFVVSGELEKFLEKFKLENPQATADEISDAIIDFISEGGHISESIAMSILKYAIPAIMAVYGVSNPSLAKDVAKKIQNKAKTTQVKQSSPKKKSSAKTIAQYTSSEKISSWVKKYAKQYGISESALLRLLKKESSFVIGKKNYKTNLIGDKGNTLGPSYGPGQIKVVMAQEIYEEEPESGINPASITSGKLMNNPEFNIKTAAKILAHYYHKKFKKVKDNQERLAFAATAYNAGITGAREHGISDYGKTVAGM